MGLRPSRSAATASANRVLPTPPGPTTVTSRCSSRAAVRAARSAWRPTNEVRGTGSGGREVRRLACSFGGGAAASSARARRLLAPSLRSNADTWLSTVRTDTKRRAAISAFVRRWASRSRTSASRSDTPASPVTRPFCASRARRGGVWRPEWRITPYPIRGRSVASPDAPGARAEDDSEQTPSSWRQDRWSGCPPRWPSRPVTPTSSPRPSGAAWSGWPVGRKPTGRRQGPTHAAAHRVPPCPPPRHDRPLQVVGRSGEDGGWRADTAAHPAGVGRSFHFTHTGRPALPVKDFPWSSRPGVIGRPTSGTTPVPERRMDSWATGHPAGTLDVRSTATAVCLQLGEIRVARLVGALR